MRNLIITFSALIALPLSSQVLTREDSLNAGLVASDRATVISGYGEAKIAYNLDNGTGTANLTRNVLFVGHRFSSKISLFSEMEVEDAKIEGGEPGGELAMEQLFLKFNINRDIYLSAGLIIPRIGIINENHLPTTFNGVDRPYTERYVIPATWRELGVAAYGQTTALPGFNWTFGIYNGLNCEGFNSSKGIRGGRAEGKDASMTNIGMSGSLLYYTGDFRIQASGYYGGTCTLDKTAADTLGLQSGPFGTPVALEEVDVQYFTDGFTFRVLGTMIQIPDAQAINNVYGNNVAEQIYGGYAEIGYNIFKPMGIAQKRMTVFARYEMFDLNAKKSDNGIHDAFVSERTFIVAGIHYQPLRGVSVKADYVMQKNGTPDAAIYGVNLPATDFNTFNLGIGYSF